MGKMALYLAGGGARGAYQAGVLKAIHHILQVKTLPFDIVSGVSVGSINAAMITQHADDFALGTERLEDLWREIHCDHIFNASNYGLSKSVLRNVGGLFLKRSRSGHLLNTDPLRELLTQQIDFSKIKQHIQQGVLDSLEIITNCYETSQTISFYQHTQTHVENWDYPRHVSQRTDIELNHVLGSSALPLFFPAIKIEDNFYGDGSMGLVSPLRGSLRFNAEKILILGTRHMATSPHHEHLGRDAIGFAHILGNMLNGLFLDNLDRDIEMVSRMNEIARLISMWKKRRSPWRPVQTLHLRPSTFIGEMAQAQYQTMPGLLRRLLNVLGAQHHSGDLLSFLLFENGFTSELIDLGYRDTIASANEVTAFFS